MDQPTYGYLDSTWVYTLEASDEAVQAALNSDPNYPCIWDANREMAPAFDSPVHLRPCGAVGKDCGVSLVELPIPMYRLASVVSIEDLGPHVYDAGFAGRGIDDEVEAIALSRLDYFAKLG